MASGSVDRLIDGIKTGIVDSLTGRVYLRDYTHAAKTFLPNSLSILYLTLMNRPS